MCSRSKPLSTVFARGTRVDALALEAETAVDRDDPVTAARRRATRSYPSDVVRRDRSPPRFYKALAEDR